MPNNQTLIELAPCGAPYPCPHLSCDEEQGEFVTIEELLRRQVEQRVRQHYHTISTDGNDDE